MKNKIFSKVVCLLVVCTMIIPGFAFAAEEKPWDHNYNHSAALMQFTPPESYVSEQNPPDFKWGYYADAQSYELIVARDPELKDVVYNKANLKYNYLSIDTTLETGIPLYWAARYKDKTGKTSTWSTVRKFRIDPDATEYVVPDIKAFIENVPKGHPRAWVNPDELEAFRNLKNENENSKAVYDYYVRTATQYEKVHQIEEEPKKLTRADFETETAFLQYHRTINGQCQGNIDRAIVCGYAYLLSGDEKLGRFAVDLVHAYCSWDAIDGLSSHKSQDQTNRHIMTFSALVYDWCYDLMTEEERKEIVEMILIRRQQVHYLLNSLDKNPYDSHGWTIYSMIGTVSYCLLHDVPEAAEWLEKVVTGYTSMLPNWGYQDGGWSQGSGYSRHSRERFNQFGRVLAKGGIDLYGKAWMRNAYLWNIYTVPFDSVGSFGDEGGRTDNVQNINIAKENPQHMYGMQDDKNNGVRKWAVEMSGGITRTRPDTYYTAPFYDSVEAVPPSTYQLSHEFSDIGWVNMTNDLMDTNRILFTFKSSSNGSFNHSHADQNAFFVEAYGQPLATYAGYYDSYHTAHHKLSRDSAAHNTITVATNKGQKPDDMTADGELTGYLTQIDFDLAVGDATEAYKGALGKFERACIYIRPDMFVIVDDLKAKGNKQSAFEWWLITPHQAETYEEGNGARLTNNGAVLDAIVHYPQKVTTYYNDIHAASDMIEINPEVRYTDAEIQKRTWFETEKVNSTKMIVTLDPHKDAVPARSVDTEYFDEYVKMTFEDGSNVIVNLTDDNRLITTKDGFTFDGMAIAYNDESIMLVKGTTLKQGETDLIVLENIGSVVMGKDEVSLSSYTDNRISINVNNQYISKFESVTDYDGRELTDAIGITYKKEKLVKDKDAYTTKESDDFVTFTAWVDNYQLMLNGKLITTLKKVNNVEVVVNGESTIVPLEGFSRRDGKANYIGTMPVVADKYKVVEVSDGLVTNLPAPGEVINTDILRLSTLSDAPQKLVVESVKSTNIQAEVIEDFDAVKATATIFKEAEDYNPETSIGVNVYNTRSFLSGGKGVSKLDSLGLKAGYKVEIKEEGDYLFAVKYVVFNDADAARSITINDELYMVNLPLTAGYGALPSDWVVAKGTVPMHLTPGTYDVIIEPVAGNWNYDWWALIKQ